MKEKKESRNKEISDIGHNEKDETGKNKYVIIPSICPKCKSENLEYEDVDYNYGLNIKNHTTITYTYLYFVCKECGCEAKEVYIEEYSHTEVNEETNQDLKKKRALKNRKKSIRTEK